MISIVVPVHDEEGSLRELASEILAVGPMGGHAPQVIFVDDGSRDDGHAGGTHVQAMAAFFEPAHDTASDVQPKGAATR